VESRLSIHYASLDEDIIPAIEAARAADATMRSTACSTGGALPPLCVPKALIRVDDVMESPKLAE
jgi:hypothetical protein